MNEILWLSFISTVFIICITPGPSVLLATANSLEHGSRRAVATILGDLSANTLQITVSALGLSTLVSEHFLFHIKWFGAGYLIWMGIQKIRSSTSVAFQKDDKKIKTPLKLYSEGFFMSASNPKAILFFASLFPLFIDSALPFWPQVAVLGTTYLILDGSCLLLYVFFASKLKKHLVDQAMIQVQNRIVGGLLIACGLVFAYVVGFS